MQVTVFNDNDFGENTYLVTSLKDAYIIDPGCSVDDINEVIEQEDLTLKGVLLTHGHYDHIVEAFEYDPKLIHSHENEKQLLEHPDINLSSWAGLNLSLKGINYFKGNEADVLIFKAILTPGHTSGCVVYLVENCLFTGDTLFYDTIGRTDTPTGDMHKMKESLEVFKKLNPEITCYPGHGKHFKLGRALQHNYYLMR